MIFSFIIINYNTGRLVNACLETIFKYCPAGMFEIILVDNDSRPEELKLVSDMFGSRIKIIASRKNLGFAGANNLGAESAMGKYLFFLNSDTLISQDILTPIKTAFENEEGIGIIAPQLVLKDKSEQPYSYGQNKKTGAMRWVSGAALVIRREIFAKIGGWDKRYFMYFEDVDLCHSVLVSGCKIKRLPEISVTHLVGGSPIPFYRRKFYYYRSKLIFIIKHYL